jgi:polyisoprenoid-binding protein YceI
MLRKFASSGYGIPNKIVSDAINPDKDICNPSPDNHRDEHSKQLLPIAIGRPMKNNKYLHMKKRIFSVLFLASLSTFVSCKKETTTTTTEATETVEASTTSASYKVDLENSVINWKGTKPTGMHTGTIKLKEGQAMVNADKLEGGKFVFDMNSITVTDLKSGDGKEDLETHLKGTGDQAEQDHFFNVGKYPTGSFEVTKVTEENGKMMITGNLTLKEISKSITIPAMITNDGTSMTIKSEPFMINRTEWKVNYASKSVFDDLKDKFVDDNIELTVDVKVLK